LKVLGVVGSHRRLGNTDILVREALMAAQETGVEIEILRMTDLDIKPCKGCLNCVVKDMRCDIEDDAYFFFDTLSQADCIILGAPTYCFTPGGIMKMAMDRVLQYALQFLNFREKTGALIAVSGLRRWDPLTMPVLQAFAKLMQFRVVGQLSAYAHGPGAILIDKEALSQAYQLGLKVVEARKENDPSKDYLEGVGVCPVCHQDVMLIKNGEIECPLCMIKGVPRIENGKLLVEFSNEEIENNSRWTPKNMMHHLEEWVRQTGPMFKEIREKVNKRKEKYRKFKVNIVKPPSST
jgi:multimeric flavodoxin WrbA